MSAKSKSATYALTLKAMPSNIPATARLKAALKALRRSYRLRCTGVVEVQP